MLPQLTDSAVANETLEELRNEWRNLCKNIPDGWLVETPVRTRAKPYVELASCAMGVLGKGLFLLPVGRRSRETAEQTLDLDIELTGPCAHSLWSNGYCRRAESPSDCGDSRLLLTETLLSATARASYG